jgi:hypothetical protein
MPLPDSCPQIFSTPWNRVDFDLAGWTCVGMSPWPSRADELFLIAPDSSSAVLTDITADAAILQTEVFGLVASMAPSRRGRGD